MFSCFKSIYLSLGLLPAMVLPTLAQGLEKSHTIQLKEQNLNNGFYYETITLESNSTPIIEIEAITKKTISAADVQFKDAVSNSFEPDVTIGVDRKKNIAYLKIPAVILNNGVYEKAENIVYKTVQTPTRTSRARTNYVDNSVLATGTWHKFSVAQKGIYKIDYNALVAMGLNPNQIDPRKIRIYGNNGTVMNETVNSTDYDDLVENAIYVSASGNTFGTNDYILLYANGPIKWTPNANNNTFEHTSNYYEDKSFYFINTDIGNGKRIPSQTITQTPTRTINTYNEFQLIENDTQSISKIGKTWWRHTFNSVAPSTLTQTINATIKPATSKVIVKTNVATQTPNPNSRFELSINNSHLRTDIFDTIRSEYVIFQEAVIADSASVNGTNIALQFRYTPNGSGKGYIDYTTLNYMTTLSLTNGITVFRNLQESNRGNNTFATYQIANANSNTKVWEVTNDLDPVAINGQLAASQYSFVSETNDLKEFVVFDGSNYLTPQAEGRVDNQNLHSLGQIDMLIITNKELEPSGQKFADFHRNREGISVEVVTIDKIYNEFSSGSRDISGIRNFIKMFYDRANNDSEIPKGVMLIGKASFDYKDRIKDNTNDVPTFQSLASSSNYTAYASDDFFVILDEGENIESINQGAIIDIAIGRIPVSTNEDAEIALDKIQNYVSENSYGPWKNTVSYIADDKDGPANGAMNHLAENEIASNPFNTDFLDFNVTKIYADAHQAVRTASGTRFPTVNKAINDQVFNGSLMLYYSGHGNPSRWATEAILTKNDYDKWTNFDKLPLIFTGTCDYSRFDNPTEESAGVQLFKKKNGGGVAVLSTTQVVYSGPNTIFAKTFADIQFTANPDGTYKPIGEAMRLAKNNAGNYKGNNKMYTLLGDPLLTLQIPVNKVVTDSIINLDLSTLTDTLSALGRYEISGSITNVAGQLLSNFNGKVYITVLDKPVQVQTIQSSNLPTPSFISQNSALAKVIATVENGKFTTTFILPKDIIYDFGKGKISYYAHSDTEEAKGFDTTLHIGGINPNANINDNEGPIVKAYIDNDKFRDGGVTGANPLLYVKLYDDNGINVSGSTVGHDLTAVLDDNTANPYNMNAYYNTFENDYQNGYVQFPFYNLADGLHNIKVKAWDVLNNSGEGMVTFEVKDGKVGFIGEIYNYPNPFSETTRFVIQHNQENAEMEIEIQIYNTSGAKVAHKKEQIISSGNRAEIQWDGKTTSGHPLTNGVYIYNITIKTAEGIKASAFQKLVYLPK